MKLGIVLAGLSPHPPIIIPEVGRGEEKGASKTVEAMEILGRDLAGADYDTLVVITPHGIVYRDAVSIRGDAKHEGSFREFGAPNVKFSAPNDRELVREIASVARSGPGIATVVIDRYKMEDYGLGGSLDHGVLVPLYYLAKHGFNKNLVVVNIAALPNLDLYRYGAAITLAARRLGRRIVVLASGDLSHRLSHNGPASYSPKGKEFDEKIMGYLDEMDVPSVVEFPESLSDEAGECGLRPIVMMLGALDGWATKSDVLSYEGPFGVGYGVAIFRPLVQAESRITEIEEGRKRRLAGIRANESYPVRLARSSVEHYIERRKFLELPKDVPPELAKPAGVFVSIHKEGLLRGCIGTTEPTTPSAAEEIIRNAVAAAIDDPRFRMVSSQELPYLDYSVDILSEPEPVESESDLDAQKYGVIVQAGTRVGLLLPDLPGVDSVAQQLEIAKRKAGIGPFEQGVKLQRFTVTRYH